MKELLINLAKDTIALAKEKARNLKLKIGGTIERIKEEDGLNYNTRPYEVLAFVEKRLHEDKDAWNCVNAIIDPNDGHLKI